MKTNISKIVLIILAGLWLGGCECVQNIDTPKVVEPVEFAKVMYVHAMPDAGGVKINSDNRTILSALSYNDQKYSYIKVAAGNSSNEIINSSGTSPILRGFVNLVKDSSYTMIFYGAGTRLKMLLLMDTCRNYSSEFSFVRYVYASSDNSAVSRKMIFILKSASQSIKSLPMTNGRFSEYNRIEPDNYTLNVAYEDNPDSLLASKSGITLLQGKLYTFLLRGITSGEGFKKSDCIILDN